MAIRTRRQLANRRRIECGIRLVAPALDLLLFAGHHIARVAGRNELELEPEPARPSAGSGAIARVGARRADA